MSGNFPGCEVYEKKMHMLHRGKKKKLRMDIKSMLLTRVKEKDRYCQEKKNGKELVERCSENRENQHFFFKKTDLLLNRHSTGMGSTSQVIYERDYEERNLTLLLIYFLLVIICIL